jgi:hypothetical protein
MTDAPQLPPVGHVHFPVPAFEPDLAFPSQDFESLAAAKTEDWKGLIPQPTSVIATTHDVDQALSAHSKGFIPPNPRSQHTKYSSPENIPSKSSKAVFSFVEVHESSGKLNTATSSHVRSMVMRKYHEKRRNLRGSIKNRHRPIAASCNHEQPLHAIDSTPERFSTFQRPYFDPQPAKTYFLAPPNRTGSTQETEPEIKANQDPRTIGTSNTVCTQCGWVMHQTPSKGRENEIVKRLEGPRTLLDNNRRDPFDSASIQLTPRTCELAHYCKSSLVYHDALSINFDFGMYLEESLAYGSADFFSQASAINPPIYHRKGQGQIFSEYAEAINVTTMMFDAASIHGMASMAAFVQLQFKQKSVREMDWKAKDDLRKCLTEANYHLSEGARLLNEKLKDPKEALSNTAIITAALLGISSVRSFL